MSAISYKTTNEELLSQKASKLMNEDGDVEQETVGFDLDYFREHFVSMFQMLASNNYNDVLESIRFFTDYVILAKNRDLVEYFLKYTGALRQITKIFLKHEVPLVVEEALHLLLCIFIWVPIDFNPKVLAKLAERCVYLFSDGTYSLNILLLDFIYNVCKKNKNFSHLIIENDAFDKSLDFLLGDCDDPKKLIKKECRTFDLLLDEIFDEAFIPDVILKIGVYLDYDYTFSHYTALSMLSKMLDHGLDISEYPSLIENFVDLTAAPKKVLMQLLNVILKINDQDILSDLICNEDFRNNLAIRCFYKIIGKKGRAKIYKLFTKLASLFPSKATDIIVISAMKNSLSSYVEKKYIFNFFIKLCESHEFAINFAYNGGLTILSASIADLNSEITNKILNILGLVGHAFFVNGHDLRQAQDYDTIAETLDEINNLEDEDIDHIKITELQKFYYNEDDA